MGSNDVEDALQELDRLTQVEARMAAAELMRITRTAEDREKGVEKRIQSVGSNVEGVGHRVRGIDDKMQGIRGGVEGANRKVDHVNRSSYPNLSSWFRERSENIYREPAPRWPPNMANSSRSIHQP